jgi:hypothetical protein
VSEWLVSRSRFGSEDGRFGVGEKLRALLLKLALIILLFFVFGNLLECLQLVLLTHLEVYYETIFCLSFALKYLKINYTN